MNRFSRNPSAPAADSDAELAEDRFFAALLAGDADELEELLSDDFLIVDVMSGSVAGRAPFIAALRDGSLKFDRITLVERGTRRHGDTAIIVGRTDMAGSFGEASFAATSRYTHVLLREGTGRWRLVSAQGTRTADQQ
jgi:ketosteroid isomerase-like protein